MLCNWVKSGIILDNGKTSKKTLLANFHKTKALENTFKKD